MAVTALPRKPQTHKHSSMETVEVTQSSVNGWAIPPFQRPLRVNDKVRQIALKIADDGGVIPGVITVGRLKIGRETRHYLIDGQHRLEAFRMSTCPQALADVRFMDFTTMADMADEFVELNSRIVNMRPDDVLRGLEESTEALRLIRQACPYVGYDNIRRGHSNAPMVSMSMALRVWEGSAAETPVSIGRSAAQLATDMTIESANQLKVFFGMAFEAWGRDDSTKRLWSALNLSLCMWIWRRIVLDNDRSKRRHIALRTETFRQCLMQLGATASYTEWLEGRALGDRDRPAAYNRIKAVFTRRILEAKAVTGNKVIWPKPAWAKG
jgi:hypothetical protein